MHATSESTLARYEHAGAFREASRGNDQVWLFFVWFICCWMNCNQNKFRLKESSESLEKAAQWTGGMQNAEVSMDQTLWTKCVSFVLCCPALSTCHCTLSLTRNHPGLCFYF